MSMHRTASVPSSHSHSNYPSSSTSNGNGSREEWQQGSVEVQGGERSGWNHQSPTSAPPNRSPATKSRKMSEGGSRQQQGSSTLSSSSSSGSTSQGAAQDGAQYTNGVSGLPSSKNSTRDFQGGTFSDSIPPNSSTSAGGSRSAGFSEPTQAPRTGDSPHRDNSLTNASNSNRSSSHRNQSLSPTSSQKAPQASGHVQYASSSYSGIDSSTTSSPAKESNSRSPRSNRQTESSSSEIEAQNAPETPHLDLASYPTQDLLRVLATLLHQIATANDELRPSGGSSGSGLDDRSSRGKSKEKSKGGTLSNEQTSSGGNEMTRSGSSNNNLSTSRSPRRSPASATTAALGALSTPSSTLCFHARNVPSISIESYLVRILKYCPTTNEVFLSLLVYFDRMSRMSTGASPGRSSNGGERPGRAAGLPDGQNSNSNSDQDGDTRMRSGSEERRNREGMDLDSSEEEDDEGQEPHPGMRGFAIDSYNVHRLVIAGVTVASKFFSDVFYTNSRYAKVS